MQHLLQWKYSNFYLLWVCVCSIRYSARNAHLPFVNLWPARFYNFLSYSYKRRDFRKKNIEHKMCVVMFSTNFVWSISLSQKFGRDMIKNVNWSLCELTVVLVRFQWNSNLLERFSKNIQYKISWKSIQLEPSFPCGRTERQTWRSSLSLFAILRTRLKGKAFWNRVAYSK